MAEEKKQRKRNYINNPTFLATLKDYILEVQEAELAGKEKPQVPKYIGECILKICTHLSYRPNFINYSYKQEMIDDAILNCFEKVLNFNPEKSDNPFAFFTTIAWNAYIRRINIEHKEAYTRGKLIEELPVEQLYALGDQDDESGAVNSYIDFLRINNYIDTTTFNPQKKKKHALVDEDNGIFETFEEELIVITDEIGLTDEEVVEDVEENSNPG